MGRNRSSGVSAIILMGLSAAITATSAFAQEVLPRPEAKFQGTIGQTYKDSTPDKIPLIKAPAGAPNVLFIMIDDAGFGNWSPFGGQIPTPNLDRLAQAGLRYTRFHTTALCSPTRAALLTGRNHHSAGTGVITEIGSGYPGYSGQIPKSQAMVSEVLRQLLLWLPNVVVALVVLVIGGLAARALSNLVRGTASEAGLSNANFLAKLASIVVWAFAIVVAVNQIGIATELVNTLFMAIVGAMALAMGLAFGLGGRETAAEIVRTWYAKAQDKTEEAHRLVDAAGEPAKPVAAVSRPGTDAA